MALYEKLNIKEYSIVDPSEKTIEQYLFKDDLLQLHATAEMSQNLSAVVIHGLSFPVKKVFG